MAGAKFCQKCGAPLAASCPGCGAAAASGQKFCAGCGARLAADTVPGFASPQGYTPPHLAERILKERGALDVIAHALAHHRGGREARAPVIRSYHVGAVAEANLAAGQLDEAEAAALDSLEWAVRLGERPWEGQAQWILGTIAARRGQRQAAARYFGQGLGVARELGMRPLAERCEQSLAALR
jgi:hypothetical protein